MRKVLFGTTALVSIAMLSSAAFADGGPGPDAPPPPPPPPPADDTPPPAAGPSKIQLELRGYAQFGLAGIVNEPSGGGGNSVVFGSDSEVHFRGRTTLDNGLTISFRTELELEDDSEVDDAADTIDEVYVQFDSAFGRLQFGMQDGAADQMIISAPNVFSQFTISSVDMNPFEMYTAPDLVTPARRIMGLSGDDAVLDTSPDFTEDFTKVIYFTPRVYGLQLGVSYAPNPCRNDTGLDVAVRAGANPDPLGLSCGNDATFGSNYWEVAGNFEQQFKGFGVGVSGSYGKGEGNPVAIGLADDDPSEWHAGAEFFLNLGSGRLTIGGAYKETDNLTAENEGFNFADSRHFDLGAQYALGPWEIGGTYGKVEDTVDFITLLERELTTIIGGVSYKMGPGIQLGVGVMHSDAEERATLIGTDVEQTDGTAVFSELDLRF
ncbi:MAG: porin [Alphaproteobacteria bacterium]